MDQRPDVFSARVKMSSRESLRRFVTFPDGYFVRYVLDLADRGGRSSGNWVGRPKSWKKSISQVTVSADLNVAIRVIEENYTEF